MRNQNQQMPILNNSQPLLFIHVVRNQRNRVIVRLWKESHSQLGHISVEIPNRNFYKSIAANSNNPARLRFISHYYTRSD